MSCHADSLGLQIVRRLLGVAGANTGRWSSKDCRWFCGVSPRLKYVAVSGMHSELQYFICLLRFVLQCSYVMQWFRICFFLSHKVDLSEDCEKSLKYVGNSFSPPPPSPKNGPDALIKIKRFTPTHTMRDPLRPWKLFACFADEVEPFSCFWCHIQYIPRTWDHNKCHRCLEMTPRNAFCVWNSCRSVAKYMLYGPLCPDLHYSGSIRQHMIVWCFLNFWTADATKHEPTCF